MAVRTDGKQDGKQDGKRQVDGRGRVAVSLKMTAALADRLDAVCDERCIGRDVVIEKALVRFLDALPTVP
jgi:hypothetical protein